MQQQMEQMGQQMQQMQAENQNLKKTTSQMSNALTSINNRRGVTGQQTGNEPSSAVVAQAQNNFGQQTGMPLPT